MRREPIYLILFVLCFMAGSVCVYSGTNEVPLLTMSHPDFIPLPDIHPDLHFPEPYVIRPGEPFITPFQVLAVNLRFHKLLEGWNIPKYQPIDGLKKPYLRVRLSKNTGCLPGATDHESVSPLENDEYDFLVAPDCSMQEYSLELLVRLFQEEGAFTGTEDEIMNALNALVKDDLNVGDGTMELYKKGLSIKRESEKEIILKFRAGCTTSGFRCRYRIHIYPSGKIRAHYSDNNFS